MTPDAIPINFTQEELRSALEAMGVTSGSKQNSPPKPMETGTPEDQVMDDDEPEPQNEGPSINVNDISVEGIRRLSDRKEELIRNQAEHIRDLD